MSDPVAAKSGFLKMYMSSHPDTLVGYAKWYGKVTEPITSAEMSAIDTKSMTLTCTLKNGSKKEVVVVIDPPLSGYDDVKPRLLEMKALSQEGLGMIKSPKITAFHLPPRGINFALGFYSLVSYGIFAVSDDRSPFFAPAQFLHAYIPPTVFKILLSMWFGIHILEGLYTISLCRKHKASFPTTVRIMFSLPYDEFSNRSQVAYFAATVGIGFHVWQDLRRRIQDARIQSVMKVE
ncbi:hypothetical protein B0H17DRAFT_1012386 [Mycena rosella]|uniref:DUF2470 domain-containing protein n=1 Tax=Mycena rosella TaxID=1033263 RepID=A0AAD7DDH6_MYCRO|nr:hypothetical protein B0H17DRAFT_1012386 [Mycena rosella]